MTSSRSKMMNCGYCEKPVRVPRNRFETFQYCSRSCKALATRVHVKAICEVCRTDFEHIASRANRAKYCSRGCYYKAQHLKGSITCACAHCGKEFRASPSENRKYCSRACVNKSSKSIWIATFSTARKNMGRRGMLTKCQRCGYHEEPRILGIHHKDRDRKNNEVGNLEVLCPMCHSLEHMHHLPQGFRE